LLLAAVLTGLAGCGSRKQSKATTAPADVQAVVVTLAQPQALPVQRTVEVVGTLWGQEETTLSAKVAGRIEAIYADVGDEVRPGGVLAQIEKTDYALLAQRSELAVREPLARLGLSELPSAGFDPASVATVQRAKFQADNAEARYLRGKQLHEQKPPLISDQDYADLRTAWEVARSNYQVELLTTRALIAEAAGRAADLRVAQQKLLDTTLRAPDPTAPATAPTSIPQQYYVAGRLVSVGEYVREGAAIFKLVADHQLKMRAAVPERYAQRLREGQQVRVTTETYPQPFMGTITRINPQVDVQNRTFGIEVQVPNAKRQLKSGSFARGLVLTEVDPQVWFVPQEAVVTFAGESKVFRVREGKAVQVDVEVGQRRNIGREKWVEVIGLKGSDPVVVSGASKLATGVPVKPRQGAGTLSQATTTTGPENR
jgi:multidrug efflux pump subunit AcrA (membrane-fusion protein)